MRENEKNKTGYYVLINMFYNYYIIKSHYLYINIKSLF